MGVTVRHNAAVASVVALLASVVTVAWFARSLQTGSVVDWVVTLVLAGIGVLQLLVVRDARLPLVVADEHGVRVRRGRTWSGLRWQDVAHVEVRSPGSWLRDGSIVVHPVSEDPEEPAEAFSVPLGMTTKVDHEGLTGDLVTDLDSLASGQVPVVVLTGVAPAEVQAEEDRWAPVEPVEQDEPVSDRFEDEHTGDEHDAVELDEQDEQDEVADDRARLRTRPTWLFRRDDRRADEGSDAVADREERADHDADDDTVDHGLLLEAYADHEPVEHDLDAEPAATDEHPVRQRRSALLRLWAGRAGQRTTARVPDSPDSDDADEADEADEDRTEPDGTVAHEQVPAAGQADEPDHTVEAEDAVEAEDDAVEPARAPRPVARAEVVRESVRVLPTPPPIPSQRSAHDVDDADGSDGSSSADLPAAAPLLVGGLDDLGGLGGTVSTAPANPVIGPRIAAARHRARLSIDTLSDRTRIRPHVLERIEVDDFAACGGDFYARGHLRTLARIFGLDAEELVALHDQHYASAEIEARQVFEAELASGIGGGVRAAHSGPRWSLLAACVVVLAGVWGVTRVFDDTPQELVSPAPNVVDSAGLSSTEKQPTSQLAPVEVTASGASPQVVVRDRSGRILWAGRLADGQRQQVIGLAPFEVTSSNGGAVSVAYLGKKQGTVGSGDAAASKRFGSR